MDFFYILGDILAFLVFLMFFLILFSAIIPDKIWGRKNKKLADEKISELHQKCRELDDKNQNLTKEIKILNRNIERLNEEKINLNNRLGDTLFSSRVDKLEETNSRLEFELAERTSKYQRALEHCVSTHPDLSDVLTNFNEPYVNNKAITFSQVILNKSNELTQTKHRIEKASEHLSDLISIYRNSSILSQTIRNTFKNEYKIEPFFDSITSNRLNNAFNSNLTISKIVFQCEIQSKKKYEVTLSQCSCDDYKSRNIPCKHMLYFAYSLGLLQFNAKECEKYTNITIEKLNILSQKLHDLEDQINTKRKSNRLLEDKEKSYKKSFETYDQKVDEIAQKKCNGYPELAGMVSDYKTLFYAQSAEYLRSKKRPALQEAMRIDELRIEAKRIEEEKSILEYKLGYIYALQPELQQLVEDTYEAKDIQKTIKSKNKTARGR